MRTLSITVSAEMAGRRVNSILRREMRVPDGFISRLKLRETGITLNGLPCRTIDRVREGDVLSAQVGDERAETGIVPINYPLDIVYEDEDCAVINKPTGMACHGSTEKGDCTLAAALAHRWGSGLPFHPVSRLDKGTSGLCCVARSAYAHTLFREALHTDAYRREYLLVCSPSPPEKCGKIELPIARESEGGIKRCISPDGAYALTEYEVLAEENGLALVKVRLHTGRTHQIRLHFAAIGCPLVGDWLYGEESEKISRPALHSAFLSMTQPITGEKIVLRAPLPEDMAALAPGFAATAETAFGKEDSNERT